MCLSDHKPYCDWARRYVKFHGMKSRADLADGTRKVEEFLTHLALEALGLRVQNVDFKLLSVNYTHVLRQGVKCRG